MAEVKGTTNKAYETADSNSDDIVNLIYHLQITRLNLFRLHVLVYMTTLYIKTHTPEEIICCLKRYQKIEGEVCTEVIRHMFVNILKLDVDRFTQIKLVRCHGVGKPPKYSPRTIICRFHYFGDRVQVWKNRSKLQGSVIRMSEDFPKEIVSKRNALDPFMFETRRQKLKKAFLVDEKLIIEGKAYTFDTLDSLPASLDMSKTGIKKVTDNITVFYGSSCWFSNFRYSPFKDGNGTLFHSSVQFLHYQKSLIFNAPLSAAKIFAAKTPGECKTLGGKVENLDFDH